MLQLPHTHTYWLHLCNQYATDDTVYDEISELERMVGEDIVEEWIDAS